MTAITIFSLKIGYAGTFIEMYREEYNHIELKIDGEGV